MKLIFQGIIKCLPFMFVLTVGILLIFSWINILLVKVFKDSEYYCDNAYEAVKTKNECFEWGGDWVKYKLNYSSIISALFFGTTMSGMEGWIYKVVGVMDLKGKDNAPQYNANEHFQIFYVVFYFLGGIITLNFFVSIMLINYRRAKESFSGEKDFTYIQKQWLSIKIYILSL